MENWKSVPRWEGWYEVSDQGRVRSVDRLVVAKRPTGGITPRKFLGKVLALPVAKNGYSMVSLTRPGVKREYRYVHSLVLEAFVGARPEGLEVCHNDGTKTNNRLENLRYDTRKSNADDTTRHGTRRVLRGESCHFSRLSQSDVSWIRAHEQDIRTKAISMRSVGKKFGVRHGTVSAILNNKTWKAA